MKPENREFLSVHLRRFRIRIQVPIYINIFIHTSTKLHVDIKHPLTLFELYVKLLGPKISVVAVRNLMKIQLLLHRIFWNTSFFKKQSDYLRKSKP